MFKYLKNILPNPLVLMYGAIFPLLVSLYIFVDRNLTNTVNSSEVNYFSFADSSLGLFIIDQSWQQWLARAMDFVLWGAIGGVLLLLFWVISSSRIAVHNHRVQEEFVNFKVSRSSWHGHFLTVAIVKTLILFLVLYCLIILIFTTLPLVIDSAALLASDISSGSILGILGSGLFMVTMQYLVVLGFKLFGTIHVDD